jgi:hypothetical protein
MSGTLDNAYGMRCPDCRRSDEIDISAAVWVRLCSDGTDAAEAGNGDHEWDNDSAAVCHSCGHAGTVREFDAGNQPRTNANNTRAERARTALQQYIEAKGEVFEDSSSEIADLITDLLHLTVRIDQGDRPIESALRLARLHFEAEHGNPEEDGEDAP